MTIRLIAAFSLFLLVAGFLSALAVTVFHLSHPYLIVPQLAIIGAAALLPVLKTLQQIEEYERSQKRVDTAERSLRENPERPQLAWELAQARLESYLNRNLSQVRSIYFWTVIVMLVGFALIGAGAIEAFQRPAQFNAAVLSAASGVIVSFIGGTFLILHRSTMAQAKEYVTVLERINAVGMSVQILESLSDDPVLKRESLAAIAKQLLAMYSESPSDLASPPRKAYLSSGRRRPDRRRD